MVASLCFFCIPLSRDSLEALRGTEDVGSLLPGLGVLLLLVAVEQEDVRVGAVGVGEVGILLEGLLVPYALAAIRCSSCGAGFI